MTARPRPRLSRATYPEAGPAAPVRLVHLGVGAFHRAHQAWYTARAGDGWGIAGVTGRSRAAVDALAPQDGLYGLVTRGPDGDDVEVMAPLSRVLDHADPEAGSLLAAPATAVVTLTVTEAGHHPEPGGAPHRLATALVRRRAADAGPLAVVSCDNLAENGRVLRDAVRTACARLDPSLADWVDARVTFPNTVVDRITPRATDDDRARVAARLGLRDDGTVVTEPFTQWVLEDAFPAGRPAWERGGAVLTDDVTPYAERKLRLLNAGHSLLAYVGGLRGHATVADAVADETCAHLLRALWAEARAELPAAGDPGAYCDALAERFANPRLHHRLAQIGADGASKLPQRVLPTIRAARARGETPPASVTAVGAWVRHLRGEGFAVDDARADTLVPLARRGPARAAVPALLAAWAPDLADDAAVRDALVELVREGAPTPP